MRPFSKRICVAASWLLLLGGCATENEYLARRDLISEQGGNAVQTNKVTHIIDPWPRVAGNRAIAHDGHVMASAYERYRTGNVTPPGEKRTPATPGSNNGGAPPANNQPVGPTVTQSK